MEKEELIELVIAFANKKKKEKKAEANTVEFYDASDYIAGFEEGADYVLHAFIDFLAPYKLVAKNENNRRG